MHPVLEPNSQRVATNAGGCVAGAQIKRICVEDLLWHSCARLVSLKDLSADVSEFLNLPADALLAATVSRIEDYGIFVMVRPPSGSVPVQGVGTSCRFVAAEAG